MPLISVIIPIYNVLPWLRECINSVLAQDAGNYEIILVDDGSNDGSGEVCDEYAGKHAHISVLHQANAGLSAARNAGIQRAKGDYLAFLDADDILLDTKLFSRLEKGARLYRPDIICFDYIRMINDAPATAFPADVIPAPASAIQLVKNNIYQSSAVTKLFRRDFLLEHHLFFLPGTLSEDVPYSGLALLKTHQLCHLPLAAYGYRVRAGSITSRISEKHFYDLLAAVEHLASLCVDKQPNKASFLGYLAYQFCTVLINWHRSGKAGGKAAFIRIRSLCWLLECPCTAGEVRVVRLCRKMLGLRITAWLLYRYFRKSNPKFS